MTAEIIYRVETYKTGSGWEYQLRRYFDRSIDAPVEVHDSLGDKKGGYESENEALRAAQPQLKKMTDFVIKSLRTNCPMTRLL